MLFSELRRGIVRLAVAGVTCTMLAGCATTFIPISWGMREKVLLLSKQDAVLDILFRRYDPERTTLRVAGESFDIVEAPHSDWRYEGAYRPEYRIIYRNLEATLDGRDLRNVMVHEMAHHIWFNFMTEEQRGGWRRYLEGNPSNWQIMVRRTYEDKRLHDAEDFAYTVEFPRTEDIEALARLAVISEEEMRLWIEATAEPDPGKRRVDESGNSLAMTPMSRQGQAAR